MRAGREVKVSFGEVQDCQVFGARGVERCDVHVLKVDMNQFIRLVVSNAIN